MNLDTAKKWWRPALSWAFIVGWASTVATILAMLWLGMATLNDASGILIALIAGGAAPATTYVHGRTREKQMGVDEYIPPSGFGYDQ